MSAFPRGVVADALFAAADRAGIGTTVTVVRPDGRYEHAFVNEAALKLHGRNREDFMQVQPLDMLAAGEAERIARLAEGALLGSPEGGLSRIETAITNKRGETVPIECVVVQIPWPDEEGGHANVTYFSDLRERRSAEAAFRDHVLRVDKLVALGTLAAGVAHEINNPTAITATSLEALERLLTSTCGDPALKQRALALVADARAGTDRVTRIVQDLRGLSRSEDTRRAVDLLRVLDGAEHMVERVTRTRVRILRKPTPTTPERGLLVLGDPGRLEQVFVNLLLNASQAMPLERGPGTIEIEATEHDDFVAVTVKDDGAGVAPEHLPRIFDPFFTTKPLGEGTGLGLSICHAIVTHLGGSISVTSERDRGTTFRVELPRARGNVPVATPEPPPSAKRARVLIVDDEPTLVRTLVSLLGNDHEVVGATSGADALGILLGNDRFDVVLCDLMMPYVTGMDLYERLAREKPGLEQRLVFMTGGAFTARARTFLRSVPNPRIDKPFSPAIVTEVLHAVIG